MNIENKLPEVFAAVLGIAPGTLRDGDSPATIAEWDSVAHLELMLALEAEFGIEFSADEMATLTSVGAIRERLRGGSA